MADTSLVRKIIAHVYCAKKVAVHTFQEDEGRKKSITTAVNESQLFSSRWASWITDCAQ